MLVSVPSADSIRRRRAAGSWRCSRRGDRAAEFVEPDSTIVRGVEVHEAPVVAGRDAEQLEQRLVAPIRLPQTATNQLTQVMSRDVPGEEHRIDVLPE